MLDKWKDTKIVLDDFGSYIVQQARSNLTKKKKNVNKKLYNSLKYDVRYMRNSFAFTISMEEYGAYQDKGVSGTQKKYHTPYSYTSKKPPVSSLYQWVKKRKLRYRSSGKFSKGSQLSLAYAIRDKIYKKGIKPSLFITKPVDDGLKKLPNKLAAAFGRDITKVLITKGR